MNDKIIKNLKLCIDEIIYLIDEKKSSLNNRQLNKICKQCVDIFEAKTDPHIYHEIAETSLNCLIKNKYAEELLQTSEPEKAAAEILKPLTERLPTKTWRSSRQIIRQQFSTPPQIPYFLSYLLMLRKNFVYLET